MLELVHRAERCPGNAAWMEVVHPVQPLADSDPDSHSLQLTHAVLICSAV